MLAINPLAIHDHVKDTSTSRDELGIHVQRRFQFCC